MPSFSKALKRDIDRTKFVEGQAKVEKKPKKRGVTPEIGVLFGARDIRLQVRIAATNLLQVTITYKKITTGERKMYRVAPYSYRYRYVKIGKTRQKTRLLFCYDMDDKHIKGFVFKNISKIVLLKNKFRPKWPVEF